MAEKSFNNASLRSATRGFGTRGTAERLRSSFRASGAVRLSLQETAKVYRAADMVRAQAIKHYEKHRESWTLKRFGKLMMKEAQAPHLAPAGHVSDRKQALMTQAKTQVAHRQAQRLQRIESARDNAVKGQPLRAARKMDWGKGLGS